MVLYEKRRTLLLVLISLSIIASISLLILNIDTGRKIVYYRSPRGVLERALNRSADADYNNTLAIHTMRFYMGIILFIIGIGGIGAYIKSTRSMNEEYVA